MKKTKVVPQYPGPSMNEVYAYSDARVSSELARLKQEPCSRPTTFLDDPDWMDESYKPKVWTKGEIAEEERKTDANHQQQLRGQLVNTYLAEWLASLSDGVLWLIVEEFEKEKIGISERRYTGRDKLRMRAGWAVYAVEFKKSGRPSHRPGRS